MLSASEGAAAHTRCRRRQGQSVSGGPKQDAERDGEHRHVARLQLVDVINDLVREGHGSRTGRGVFSC